MSRGKAKPIRRRATLDALEEINYSRREQQRGCFLCLTASVSKVKELSSLWGYGGNATMNCKGVMSMNDYKDILFSECLEEIDNQKVQLTSDEYEKYAEEVVSDLKQRNKLSNLRTNYGVECKKAGWYSGFYTAIQILRELLIY